MTTEEFEQWLIRTLTEHYEESRGDTLLGGFPISFKEAGMLNYEHGVVCPMIDNTEFRLTIHQAR